MGPRKYLIGKLITTAVALLCIQAVSVDAQGSSLFGPINCQKLSASHYLFLERSRSIKNQCDAHERVRLQGTWLKDRTARNACKMVNIGFVHCTTEAIALCDAYAQRDKEMSDCRARNSATRAAKLAEEYNSATGVEFATNAADALNGLRNLGPNSATPAGLLSEQLTLAGIASAGAAGREAIKLVDSALAQFGADTNHQLLIETIEKPLRFQPMGHNPDGIPPDFVFSERYSALSRLAAQTKDQKYDLPFGELFSSDGPAQSLLRIATEQAVNGNPQLMGDMSRTGELALHESGNSVEFEGQEVELFDMGYARTKLAELEQAHRTARNAARTNQASRTSTAPSPQKLQAPKTNAGAPTAAQIGYVRCVELYRKRINSRTKSGTKRIEQMNIAIEYCANSWHP